MRDADIQCSALEIASNMNCKEFKAGHKWLRSFKKKFSTVSREIAILKSKSHLHDVQKINDSEINLTKIKDILPNYEARNVFSTDQSGIEQNLHKMRTLEK